MITGSSGGNTSVATGNKYANTTPEIRFAISHNAPVGTKMIVLISAIKNTTTKQTVLLIFVESIKINTPITQPKKPKIAVVKPISLPPLSPPDTITGNATSRAIEMTEKGIKKKKSILNWKNQTHAYTKER